MLGSIDGFDEICSDGDNDGSSLREKLGWVVGFELGDEDGDNEFGFELSDSDFDMDGLTLDNKVGCVLGVELAVLLGDIEGNVDGVILPSLLRKKLG
mmetsp:Transcript_25005/g.28933  ORF Transcript_25005/g.28933 Transcript_25005/m.28933 type:complete len:97 (+) Transcript_25005:752-1042(+)